MVPLGIFGVHQDEHKVKATQQGARQGHVDTQRLAGIVTPFRVGGRQDARPRVEFAHDTEKTEERAEASLAVGSPRFSPIFKQQVSCDKQQQTTL